MGNLNYEQFDGLYTFVEGFEKTEFDKADFVVSEIYKRQAREKAKQEQIDELTYEKDLITSDIVNTIRTDLCNSKYNIFYGMTSELLRKAWLYNWHKTDKKFWGEDIEKAKKDKKDSKSCFEYVVDTIKRKILNNDDTYELIEIIDSNYSRAYCFTYKYKDQTIQITIPMWSQADRSTYKEMLQGYRINYAKSEHFWDFICCNIDYRKVAEQLAEWVKDNCRDI